MRIILLLSMFTISSWVYAQKQPIQQEKYQSRLPNWDSINNSRLGMDYVPFSITTLDGRKIDNSTTKGKVVFFTFWFKACAPCLKEFAELNELYGKFNNDSNVVFVAITFDKEEDIRDVLSNHDVKFPIAKVPSIKEARRMNYDSGFPSLIILDKFGKVCKSGTATIVPSDRKSSLSTITADSAVSLISSKI
jgi:peroxiredoxin